MARPPLFDILIHLKIGLSSDFVNRKSALESDSRGAHRTFCGSARRVVVVDRFTQTFQQTYLSVPLQKNFRLSIKVEAFFTL